MPACLDNHRHAFASSIYAYLEDKDMSSVFFAGVSGSSVADAAALSSTLVPAMRQQGYARQYAAAVTVASSVTGPIIPPSIILIFYGALMQTSVGALFAAGLIAGMFMDAPMALFLLVPLFGPPCVAMGFDPTHLGIILCLNITMGLITPPIGACLIIISSITGENYWKLSWAVLPFALAGFSQAGSIKIALDSPPDMEKSGTYVWAKTFSDDLMANGLKVELFPREALGNEEEKLDQVSQGLLEISCSDVAKAGQLEAKILGFNLPFLFDDGAHLDRVIFGTDIMEKVNDGLSKKGVRAMDKIQAGYINAWGASTVIVTWAEIYNSLQTGVADGYLNPAIVPVMFKHTEVLKYFSDIKVSSPLRVSICSEQWYRKLNEKERAMIADAVKKADAANRIWLSKIETNDTEALKAAGVDVYKNTPEEIAQFAELSRKEYSNIVTAEIVDLFLAASKSKR